MVERVIATEAALALIELLKAKHGPNLMFFQSGGCCDNSAPNCYIQGELTVGAADVLLGHIGDLPFFIGKAQFEYWQHTQLIIDVLPGYAGNFSLEGSENMVFHARSRLYTDEEWQSLAPVRSGTEC